MTGHVWLQGRGRAGVQGWAVTEARVRGDGAQVRGDSCLGKGCWGPGEG